MQPAKTILGLSAYYHDSAAALIKNGEIVAAAQEERFTRKKHDAGFPENAIRYCLAECGLALSDVDEVVFYDKPLVKFERLLETYLSYAPNGLRSFIAAMPIWLKEKLYLKSTLKKISRKKMKLKPVTKGIVLSSKLKNLSAIIKISSPSISQKRFKHGSML